MSVDLNACRNAIAAWLAGVAEITEIDAYENTQRTITAPIAQVWLNEAGGPDLDEPTGLQLGSFTYLFTFLVRVYLPLEVDEAAAQRLADLIAVRLREELIAHPGIDPSVFDAVAMPMVVCEPLIGLPSGDKLLVEATLRTRVLSAT